MECAYQGIEIYWWRGAKAPLFLAHGWQPFSHTVFQHVYEFKPCER
jgi:hypothetical protein